MTDRAAPAGDRPEPPDADGIVAALDRSRPAPADAMAVARWMRLGLLPHHAVVYGAPEVHARLEALGITDRFARYLAERAAPMGSVPAAVVVATFFGFGPAAIETRVPAVWEVADPADVLAATLEGMAAFLARVLVDEQVRTAAERLGAAVAPIAAAHPTAGRPLAAAWAAVAPTGDPLVDLWLDVTVMRESRGDGHLSALAVAGIGPLEADLLTTGDDPARRPALARWLAWEEEDVAHAGAALRARGLLDASGRRTDEARELRAHIEDLTDAACAAPWRGRDAAVIDAIATDALTTAVPLIASGGLLRPALAGLAAAARS